MRIWRNLDPKLLAQLLIQASECLKTREAERRTRKAEVRSSAEPRRSATHSEKSADIRHV